MRDRPRPHTQLNVTFRCRRVTTLRQQMKDEARTGRQCLVTMPFCGKVCSNSGLLQAIRNAASLRTGKEKPRKLGLRGFPMALSSLSYCGGGLVV
jgi:hypothetical protein